MSTITTLNTSDSGATSRVTINTNFTNLNTDKVEKTTPAMTGPLAITIAGIGTTLTNPLIQATNSVNNFTQIAAQNKTAGSSASSDCIAYPDNNANDTTGFVDIGVASSTFSDASYIVTGPNDAYLFGSAVSGAGKVGNLVIATDSTGSANEIPFYTGGFNSLANERVRVVAQGLSVGRNGSLTGSILFRGSASGTTTLTASTTGSGTLTLPTATDTLVGKATTDTLTNKRVSKRVLALSGNSAIPTINTDNYDVVNITSQTAAITSFTTNLTGTPVAGDTLRISVTGTASVALTFGASFEASTVALPTTTSGTTRLDMGFFWNIVTSKWRIVATA